MSQKYDYFLDWWMDHFYTSLTPKQIVKSLSCEQFPSDEAPMAYYRALIDFRHMSQKDRLRTCESYLRRRNVAK